MKKYLIALSCAFFVSIMAFGQTISLRSNKDVAIPDKASISIDLPKDYDFMPTSVILFSITNVPKGGVTVKVEDDNKADADLGKDYDYVKIYNESKTSDNGSMTYNKELPDNDFLLPIEIKTITKKARAASFKVTITPKSGGTVKTFTVKLLLNAVAGSVSLDKARSTTDTSKWFLSIVTGGNFDFFNGASIKDFAGDITLFLPNLFKIGSLNVGIEFGLANYHYFNNDSTHTDYYRDSYFQHYRDFFSPSDTSKVVIETKNVNRKFDYNVWGIHLDPMTSMYSDDLVQLYGKLHFEELMTVETYTPGVNATTYDTVTYQQYQNAYAKSTLQTLAAMPSPSEDPFYQYRQHTYHDLYFGTGLGLVVNFKNVAKFTGSTTIGIASLELAEPNFFPNDPSNRNVIDVTQNPTHMRTGKFYTLNRFQFVTTVAPVDIAIGGEYRTVASNMYYFTTYIGATVTLDKIKR